MYRVEHRLLTLTHHIRKKESHKKFLLGLAFEKSGLAFLNNLYLDSQAAFTICDSISKKIKQEPKIENLFHQKGEKSFYSKTFMENNEMIEKTKLLFGQNWKRERYHNLVRLGGDIMRSGLINYPKTIIMGALLHFAQNS